MFPLTRVGFGTGFVSLEALVVYAGLMQVNTQ